MCVYASPFRLQSRFVDSRCATRWTIALRRTNGFRDWPINAIIIGPAARFCTLRGSKRLPPGLTTEMSPFPSRTSIAIYIYILFSIRNGTRSSRRGSVSGPNFEHLGNRSRYSGAPIAITKIVIIINVSPVRNTLISDRYHKSISDVSTRRNP